MATAARTTNSGPAHLGKESTRIVLRDHQQNAGQPVQAQLEMIIARRFRCVGRRQLSTHSVSGADGVMMKAQIAARTQTAMPCRGSTSTPNPAEGVCITHQIQLATKISASSLPTVAAHIVTLCMKLVGESLCFSAARRHLSVSATEQNICGVIQVCQVPWSVGVDSRTNR